MHYDVIIYAVKWPQKWFMEVSWKDINVSDLPEKTDFNPWLVFLTVSKWSGRPSRQMSMTFFASSSTWLKADRSTRLLPETFLLGIQGLCWQRLLSHFLFLIDTTLAVAAEWLHFHLWVLSCPSIVPLFHLPIQVAGTLPQPSYSWNYLYSPLCSRLSNVAETLPAKSFLFLQSASLFHSFCLPPEKAFYIFCIWLNWKDNNMISHAPMTYLLLIPFRCLTNDNIH